MSQSQQQRQPRGVFDKKTEPDIKENNINSEDSKKENFKDPFDQQSEEISKRSQKSKPELKNLIEDQALVNTANAVNNAGSGKNVQADLDEMDKFSENDIKLAEQMIFNGYAEYDEEIPNFPNHKFTICSTSAEEIAIVEEIIFDMIKKAERDDGTVNLPQSKVTGLRNGLFVAISYRGMDKNEIATDTSCQLNTIKRAVIRVAELENMGNLEDSEKLKTSLKKRLLQRASIVNRMATPLIDFLSDSKYKFDSKMLGILRHKDIIPKS